MSDRPSVAVPNGWQSLTTEAHPKDGWSKTPAGASVLAATPTSREGFIAASASEADLRDFVEAAPVAMHSVSGEGTILWANQAELDLLGYSHEEYIGSNIAQFHADKCVIDEILLRL